MIFKILKVKDKPKYEKNTSYLRVINWNDYSFVTMFNLICFLENGEKVDVGAVKIGYIGQTHNDKTYDRILSDFESLDQQFFSLGQSVDFYKNISELPNESGKEILKCLRDIVLSPDIIEKIKSENVFSTSLLRDASLSIIKGQYFRVINGMAELTDFKFKFSRSSSDILGAIDLSFEVNVGSTPNTNIHAVIGRNGVGKTTLLNGMIKAITEKSDDGQFKNAEGAKDEDIPKDYFSSLVSVSFSAFDPFTPPAEQPDPAKGTCYFYVGLKDSKDNERNRTLTDLRGDCINSLISCFNSFPKLKRWLNAIEKLGSDENFSAMKLGQLAQLYFKIKQDSDNSKDEIFNEFKSKYSELVEPFLSKMSSGHAVVLLTITRLVATVEEKTLVLLDEPESHLHPPLLSAFVRALSDLMRNRNGVAIIATHSPVVLQEIPQTCIWKLHRVGKSISSSRPSIATFGENVGVLTSEVFSLEVERSGFHNLLSSSVAAGGGYAQIIEMYKNQLGFEGRSILRALISDRDGKAKL